MPPTRQWSHLRTTPPRQRPRTRAATSPSRARAPTSRTRRSRPRRPIAGRRTLLLRVTDAAGNQTVSLPFAISARGPVNGSGGGDGARVVAGLPRSHLPRPRQGAQAGRRAAPEQDGGLGSQRRGARHPAQRRRPAGGGRPAAAARARAAPRRALRRSRRRHHRCRRALPVPDPARLLAALPDRLPRLSGRRGAHRQVGHQLQHQSAHHRPRAPGTSARAGACASAAASPAARCRRAA